MRPRPRGGRGFAIVVTLGAVVLITALVLAFFSRAILNRQIAYSYTSALKADLLARSSLDIVAGELRDEIADATRSTATTNNGVPVYSPSSPDSLPAAPEGLSSPSGALVKVSAANAPLRPGGPLVASSVGSDAASSNGHFLSSSTWFTSTTQSPQLGSNGKAPTWLFVTRLNGVKTPQVGDAKNAASGDAVVGRFAYAIYDLGGLLDANVAGSPGAAASYAPFKASAAYADLSQIGLSTTAVSAFLSWRNAATGIDAETFEEWASGIPRAASSGTSNGAALQAAASGHLAAAGGDNAFLSRRDLLNDPSLSGGAFPYLTHYSRAVTAPSSSPAVPTAINPNLPLVAFANAGTVTHYKDDGTSSAYPAAAGDPLLQRPFSLARLAWITYRGPSAGLASTDPLYNAGGTAAAIQSCFGLKWSGSATGWSYVGSVGGAVSASIETLAQVAAETAPREPNFFELIKAGVLSGSLGKASNTVSASVPLTLARVDQATLEGSKDLQVMRIGAAMIDNASPANCPTTLVSNMGGTNVAVYGVKDLPYLQGLVATHVSQVTCIAAPTVTSGTTTYHDINDQLNWCTLFLAPMLYNPHRSNGSVSGMPNNVAASQIPPAIRVRIVSGTLTDVTAAFGNLTTAIYTDNPGGSPPAASANPLAHAGLNVDLSLDAPIVIPSASFARFQAAPKVVRTGDASGGGATSLAAISGSNVSQGNDPADYDIQCFGLYTFPANTSYWTDQATVAPATALATSGPAIEISLSNVVVVLEYQDPVDPTTWHVYDTMAGNMGNQGSGTGLSGANIALMPPLLNVTTAGTMTRGRSPVTSTALSLDTRTANNQVSSYIGKLDPRTTRFGPSLGEIYTGTLPAGEYPLLPPADGQFLNTGGLGSYLPFGLATATGALQGGGAGGSIYPGLWVQGDKTSPPGTTTPPGWSPTASLPPAGREVAINNVGDSDGILRPADAWLGNSNTAVSGTSSIGNFLFTGSAPASAATSSSRPALLHRPYRTVGELGFVFRDSVWKTLNFSDETSAESVLLDLFSVSDEPAVVAGKTNLNTTQPLVLQALLSGTGQAADGTGLLSSTGTYGAQAIAAAYQSFAFSSGVPTSAMPMNLSQFVLNFMTPGATGTTGPLAAAYPVTAGAYAATNSKIYREAIVRALSGTTQSRTWNLLIDVVAQTGRYPGSAASLGDFLVEGEKRYWLSLSIDRYTGKVVGQQLEPASE